MAQPSISSLLQHQLQTLTVQLGTIKKQHIIAFAIKIYPVMASQQPQKNLLLALKKHVILLRAKSLSFQQIANDLISKAYAVDSQLGLKFKFLIKQEKNFLSKFQAIYCQQAKQNMRELNKNFNQKLSDSKNQDSKCKQKKSEDRKYQEKKCEEFLEKIQPPKNTNYINSNQSSPLSSPFKNYFFIDSPLFSSDKQSQEKEDLTFNRVINKPESQNLFSNLRSIDFNNQNSDLKVSSQLPVQKNNRPEQKIDSFETKIDSLQHKKKKDHYIYYVEDPLSSARPATSSPIKPFNQSEQLPLKSCLIAPSSTKINFLTQQNQNNSIKVGQKVKIVQKISKPFQKFVTDLNYVRNLSEKSLCFCEALCENITLSQDSFYCAYCQNIYHKRCMKKSSDSKNCLICHLKFMIPNKVVRSQLFVGLLRKGKKKHEITFKLRQEMFNQIKSRKDFSLKLQVRCLRIKSQTQNQNIFPDSCTIFFNTKQLKQFKPLHKQSSLKYRRDQPIPIIKNYLLGQNKIILTQFQPQNLNALERIQPQDHLIAVYIIEQQQINATVERIIKNYVTTFQESKRLLAKAFYLNDDSNLQVEESMEDSEAISCEVVKIPLTCALTTQKLNFPARGFLCQHFQCFDLKNFIMMTSSSSNPRWICPICKASCYEFRIDCIVTQILNQYTGCNKVETLVLYKDGSFELLDKDQDSIDKDGHKLKVPQLKNISELKIQDRLKRERQNQDCIYLQKKQQAEKKKKKSLQIPPEDKIVSLVSDSD